MEAQDYNELVNKLRDLHRDPRPASAVWLFENQLALYDAAAAIESLQKELDAANHQLKMYSMCPFDDEEEEE